MKDEIKQQRILAVQRFLTERSPNPFVSSLGRSRVLALQMGQAVRRR